jgi:vacuolar protein sorting-associated protein 11
LQEKPTTTKLDILFHKSLYVLAINLARTQSLDEASIADIHRRYGDHLYLKGDYDGAMQQFIKTLGYLQPSYVIRKVQYVVALG